MTAAAVLALLDGLAYLIFTSSHELSHHHYEAHV